MLTVCHSKQATHDSRKTLVAAFVFAATALLSHKAGALTYAIPTNGNIVGDVQETIVQEGDNLSYIGKRFGIGGYEMVEANPNIDYSYPQKGTKIVIPSRFILPNGHRDGIVINLAEMRLYYYHPDRKTVTTFPIGIGQEGWLTPVGTTQITSKRKDPWWNVPESIMKNSAKNGKPIEARWPPGPKNPLGTHAMNLGFKNIVMHGTPYPMGVGIRSSHGCIRMWNEDVSQLFSMVSVGTKVHVVHEPNKVGISGEDVYLEAHVPLKESDYDSMNESLDLAVREFARGQSHRLLIRWDDAKNSQTRASGYPQPIGIVQ